MLLVLAVGTAAGVAGMSEAGAAVVTAQSFSATAANDARFTDNSDPARTSNSFTVSGTLKNEAGVPVPNLDVTVSLDPSPAMLLASEKDPDAAVGLGLAGSRTDANGRYSVTIPALKNISDYIDDDGSVSLLFTSFGPADLVYRQLVKLPAGSQTQAKSAVVLGKVSDSEPGATDPARPDVDVTETPVSGAQASASTAASTDDGQTLGDLNLTVSTTSGVKALATTSVNPATECNRAMGNVPWSNYEWRREFQAIRQWVPVQRVQTKGHTKVSYEWSNTKGLV
jgi:hypothetical protein